MILCFRENQIMQIKSEICVLMRNCLKLCRNTSKSYCLQMTNSMIEYSPSKGSAKMTFYAKTTLKDLSPDEGIEYSLFVTDPFFCDSVKEKVFSLLAVRYSGGVAVEDSFMYDVCRSEDRALRILEILRVNRVSPCHLKDVVYDLI